MSRTDAEALLALHAPRLTAIVRHEAAGLLRFESEEDLLQGIRQRVIEKIGSLRGTADGEAEGWLATLARNWLHGRRAHWSALKRDGGALLRFTLTASDDGGAAPLPADTSTGPATLADRLEQLTLATRALALLLDRDRDLVRWSCDGLPVADMAERLTISEEAAGKARQRALERLRKAHRLVSGT
jgi:DNA-directed RNA polymerase specialized sigma24 family protein